MVAGDASNVGNHIACTGGLINTTKNFIEYLVEVDRNDYVYSEDEEERLFSFGEIMKTIKKELVYVEKI